MPAPTNKNDSAAAAKPIHAGASLALPAPARTSKAKGMMARPPNCTIVPIQM